MNEVNVYEKVSKRLNENPLLEPLSAKQKVAVRSYLQEEISENNKELLEVVENSLRSLESLTIKYRKDIANMERIYGLDFDAVQKSSDVYEINVRIENNVLIIDVPGILPHRRTKPYIIFTEQLRLSLMEMLETIDFAEFVKGLQDNCVAVFEFGFSSKKMLRDADNIECKAIIDVLTEFAIPNDDGGYLSIYKTCALKDSSKTVIKVMNMDSFLLYLKQ